MYEEKFVKLPDGTYMLESEYKAMLRSFARFCLEHHIVELVVPDDGGKRK